MDKKKNLEYTLKGPMPVFLDEDRPDQRSGNCVLDVSFAEPITIGEILFRNYYTACVTILCKKVPLDKDVRNRDLLPWLSSVKHIILMADPHCEQGSQDQVAITPAMSLVPWSRVVGVRFCLKQPSSYWRRFTIEELVFHKEVLHEQKQMTYIPRMFANSKGDTNSSLHEGHPKDDVTMHLQNLKHITESMKTMHTGATIGRFEIAGSYDVSHLI